MDFPRHLLEKYFGDDPRLVAAFEEQATAVDDASNASSAAVSATGAIKDAAVVVLSENSEFTNERVLEVGPGIKIEVDGNKVRLSADPAAVAIVEGGTVKFVALGDSDVFLPLTGHLITAERPRADMTALGNYANDAAAAAGGVHIGDFYRNASVLMVRVA